ncbi:hypothetical protein SLEP1_g7774 [Rubroshorea leprosula]|uniref:Enoyl reductase (ER) domain-containing protein n=1 Tax=Rubroshorea leprosula TaxID=152421 RepID=A0AAV5I9E9_9ROSI|nr:hypothetical protein SLEP1_g7774 [Rubroshorea leprosula]
MSYYKDTVKAIRIHRFGGPEVLRWEDVPVPEPKEHELKIRVHAVSLTPYDISVRKGEGAVRGLPLTPGWDAVGEVVAVGPGVTTPKVGEMVAHIGDPQSEIGTYAEEFILPASSAIPIPKELSCYTAGYIASVLRPGLTTIALVKHHFRQNDPNFWVLVHTVNNDIAEKLCSYLRYSKANVIATMEGTLEQDEIPQLLDSQGVHVIGLNNLEEQVNHITKNNGVDVVYLSLGDDSTFKETEKCLKRTGHIVYYIHTYMDPRPAPTFSGEIIAHKSISLSIPKLDDLITSRENLLDSVKVVSEMVGRLVLFPNLKCDFYEMEYAADAHSSWESGCQATPIVLYLKGTEHINPAACTECTTHNQVYLLQPGGPAVTLLSEGAEAAAAAAV